MNELQDTLPDLMCRATDGLEPDSPDLVERGMRRGVVLRRRRRALTGAAATAAVLLSGGAVVGGHLLGSPADAGSSLAAQPAATASSSAKPAKQHSSGGTPAQAVQTLRRLLPAGVRIVSSDASYDNADADLYVITVAAVIDDGKGRSALDLQLTTSPKSRGGNQGWSCKDRPERCRVLPDGSALSWSKSDSDQAAANDPSGHIAHSAVIGHPNHTAIALGNGNGVGLEHFVRTRPAPILSVAQLKVMVQSSAWRFATAPR